MKKLIITSVIFLGSAGAIFAQTADTSADKSKSDKAAGQAAQTSPAKNEVRQTEIANENSMLFSREAIAIRRKNMTEPDTEVKSGSGSSERNTKNHTGTTGNYRNLATQTSRIPSAE